MKCKICSRKAQDQGFCMLHLTAYHNLIEKFEVWKRALSIEWSRYLMEIQKNSLTGVWAKEVAEYLFKDGEEKQ